MAIRKFIALEWNAPELYGVLGELKHVHGWQLQYCTSYGMKQRIEADFPDAIYHETHDARYGVPAERLADLTPVVLDQPMAEALSFPQVMSLKQMDRMELMGSFPLHDRLILFHKLVGYWTAVLDKFRPDVLLMPTSPHVAYDYIAYVLARRRGIPIILFEYVTLAGMLAAMDGFENGIPQIQREYKRLRASPPASVILSDRMERHLAALKGTYEGARPFGLEQMISSGAEHKKAREIAAQHDASELRKLAEYEATKVLGPIQRFRRKMSNGGSWLSLAALKDAALAASRPPTPPVIALSRPPNAEGYRNGAFDRAWPEDVAREAADYRKRHIDELTRCYDELAVTPDLTAPYVYVALHLQPERATNPNGGVFDEQGVLVALIASVLPKGWRIYVKEHPSHFLPHYATERGRWTSFYKSLLQLPSVSLVSRNISSFSLIDNARAVASVTGTSSWEALVRGIPTLVFGEAWYKGCEGSYAIRTTDDCRTALQRISDGERPTEENVRLFLHAAENVSFVGFISSDDEHIAGIDRETNYKRLANAIVEADNEARQPRTHPDILRS